MSFNVLIVDDSGAMRAVIKKIITISGFKMSGCFEAANGREALDQLKKNWVDVIISDVNMPEMNGLELLQALSRDPLYQNIPAIIVSTEGSSERMKEAFDRGAKGFIKKPFLPEDIRSVLHDVIGVGADGEYQEDPRNADDGDF
ncbi:MAG: response regulator [Deltaproteobacteria bacterium]|jgi:two-component system chemotaxis response regulator CheY|nr:response regulator [Deltaproteobacteria bacterium]